jgi:hypothetical protein
LCAFLISPMRVTCPTRLIPLDLITLMIFSVTYKLWSFSFCSLLQHPVTSFFGPNVPPALCF